LLDGTRVVLADIAGVHVGPGPTERGDAGDGAVLRPNTYAHPCHSGFVMVDDSNSTALMRLCGDWAMLQLAWDLLGLSSKVGVGTKSLFLLQFGMARVFGLAKVLKTVDLFQTRAHKLCEQRGADPAMLALPTLDGAAELMVDQLELMVDETPGIVAAQQACCEAYAIVFPGCVARLRQVNARIDTAYDSGTESDY
jgi:hypothetical protein